MRNLSKYQQTPNSLCSTCFRWCSVWTFNLYAFLIGSHSGEASEPGAQHGCSSYKGHVNITLMVACITFMSSDMLTAPCMHISPLNSVLSIDCPCPPWWLLMLMLVLQRSFGDLGLGWHWEGLCGEIDHQSPGLAGSGLLQTPQPEHVRILHVCVHTHTHTHAYLT